MEDPSFGELLDRAKHGDQSALDSLHVLVRRELTAWASRALWHDLRALAESQDLLQEVHVRICRSLAATRATTPDSFLNWVRSVAEHTLRDLRRHLSAHRRNPIGTRKVTAPLSFQEHALDPSSSDTTPCTGAARREEQKRVMEALGHLAARDRAAIELRDFEGMEFAAIAQKVGFPSPEAARKAYRRALIKLGKLLEHR